MDQLLLPPLLLPVVWPPAGVWRGRRQQAWLRRASFHRLPLGLLQLQLRLEHLVGVSERQLIEAEARREKRANHLLELIGFVFARVVQAAQLYTWTKMCGSWQA